MARAAWLVGAAAIALSGCDHGPRPDKPSPVRADSATPPSARASAAARRPARPAPRAPGAAVVPTHCTRSVARDLEAWRDALIREHDAKRRNALLAELALAPVDAAAELVKVDVVKAALGGDAPNDRIVVAHLRVASPRSDSMRVQVLRAQGKNAWCVIGGDLSTDQDFGMRACLGGDGDDPPVSVAPLHLRDAKRDALRVVTEEGHCESCGRAGHFELAYYDASGFALRRIYSLVLYDAVYSGCPWPPVKEEIGSHELVGDFPRTIVATLETVCSAPAPDLPAEYRTPCAPKVETIQSEYKGGKYVQSVHSSRDGTQSSRLALADSGFRDLENGVGWGNRCVSHLRAGQLAYARAACEHGLADKPADATRGALFYNLASVEVADHDTDAACRLLARSLIARPKNDVTREKAAELGCKP